MYYLYCQNEKRVYVLGSQFIRKLCLDGYKSVTKLHRNVCEQSLKPKCHLLVHRSTLQNKIYYCVLLTMLHVIGHYWYKNQLHITILQLLYTKQVIDFNQRQAEYFDSYKGSVQSYWTKLKYYSPYYKNILSNSNQVILRTQMY